MTMLCSPCAAIYILISAGLSRVAVADIPATCFEHPNIRYRLKSVAAGRNFFEKFHFVTVDGNNGATDYRNRRDAYRLGIAQAYDTHAILSAGPRSERKPLKRSSAKIFSKEVFTYFLTAVRFTHVPYGCGVWPAFWTHAVRSKWPEGGELDILEYVNDKPSQTAFHTGRSNHCRLNAALLNQPGCPSQPDLNGMAYDCRTDYPDKTGCAPNRVPVRPGAEWAQRPGVIAVEWTPSFIKIFYIPEDLLEEMGLAGENQRTPEPDTWDRFIMAYYPLAASERAEPGSCPKPWKVLKPQQLVFNIGFCGDWAGKVWDASFSCVNRVGPSFPDQCQVKDPMHDKGSMANDCCTKYVIDQSGEYDADNSLKYNAYWNFTWIKTWQWAGRRMQQEEQAEISDKEEPKSASTAAPLFL